MATKKKTAKKQTYTVRCEWDVTYYCDTTVEATSREEAARIVMEEQEPDYGSQESYDDSGDTYVAGVSEGDDFDFMADYGAGVPEGMGEDGQGDGDPRDARAKAAGPELLAICEAACLRSIERQEMGGRGGVLDDDIFQQMAELVRRCRDE